MLRHHAAEGYAGFQQLEGGCDALHDHCQSHWAYGISDYEVPSAYDAIRGGTQHRSHRVRSGPVPTGTRACGGPGEAGHGESPDLLVVVEHGMKWASAGEQSLTPLWTHGMPKQRCARLRLMIAGCFNFTLDGALQDSAAQVANCGGHKRLFRIGNNGTQLLQRDM